MKPRRAWTSKEKAAFARKLRRFSDGLPEDQRQLFRGLVKGAAATVEVGKRRPVKSRQLTSFTKKVATFRGELGPREKEAFKELLMASAIAWCVEAGRFKEGSSAEPPSTTSEPGVIYFWHAVHLARTAAVIIAGAVTVILEGMEDDEEPQVPEIDFPPADEPVQFP